MPTAPSRGPGATPDSLPRAAAPWPRNGLSGSLGGQMRPRRPPRAVAPRSRACCPREATAPGSARGRTL
eukprot:5951371-Alexandrium_andersonii.AAC.1